MTNTSGKRLWSSYWFIPTLGIIIAAANFLLHMVSGTFGYDEGDYVRAARKGIVNNWLDNDDMPTRQFIKLGLQAVNGTKSIGELAQLARSSKGTAFLRHHHGPIAWYPATALQKLPDSITVEQKLRVSNLFWMVFGLAMWGVLSYLALRPPSAWILLLPSSTSFAMALGGFNMHIPFAVTASLFLTAWSYYEDQPENRRMKFCAVALLACALISVEYSMFIIAGGLLWVLKTLWSKRGLDSGTFALDTLKNSLWLGLALMLLWPGGLIQLNLIKSYAFQGYMGLMRVNNAPSPYGSLWETITGKWNASPLEIVLFLGVVALLIANWRQIFRRGSLFVSAVTTAGITYTQLNPALSLTWYLFPLFAIAFWFVIPLFLGKHNDEIIRRPKFLSSDYMAVLCSGAAFAVACVVVPVTWGVPIVEGDIEPVNRLIVQNQIHAATITHNVAPVFIAYNPNVRIRSLYSNEFTPSALMDSLRIWGAHEMLILKTATPLPPNVRKVFSNTAIVVTIPDTAYHDPAFAP